MRTCLAAMLIAASLLTSCISFSGGADGGPLFQANFREGSTFPHIDPFNNVLLLDVTERADYAFNPPEASLRIDGELVQVVTVEGGRNELPFPPAAWTPSEGPHELEITIADIDATLPFSWND